MQLRLAPDRQAERSQGRQKRYRESIPQTGSRFYFEGRELRTSRNNEHVSR